jgi:molecular chaperone DnaK (HSP70)
MKDAKILIFLLSFLATFCLISAQSSKQNIIAFDLGNEWLKVAIHNPSAQFMFDMAVDDQSNRKTPAFIGFDSDGERQYGDHAFSLATRKPHNAISGLIRILGRKYDDDEEVKKYLEENRHYKIKKDPIRGGVAFTIDEDYTVEELIAMLLSHGQKIATK